jgi:hypothetical protein
MQRFPAASSRPPPSPRPCIARQNHDTGGADETIGRCRRVLEQIEDAQAVALRQCQVLGAFDRSLRITQRGTRDELGQVDI